jgi:hypothetical protein
MRKEFLQLSGHVPLLPQWAFGLWFTWYHPYNQSEKTAEIQRFIDDDLGLDVASLDRNWRLYGGGTGPGPLEGLYQENKTLLPDLDGFFDWVHQNNVRAHYAQRHIFWHSALSRVAAVVVEDWLTGFGRGAAAAAAAAVAVVIAIAYHTAAPAGACLLQRSSKASFIRRESKRTRRHPSGAENAFLGSHFMLLKKDGFTQTGSGQA